MIYTKHSNGKLYYSNNKGVIDILTNEELEKKRKSLLNRLFNYIKVR